MSEKPLEPVEPPPKEGIYIRLDSDVLAYFKERGRGYQVRINTVLRQAMQRAKRRASKG